MKQLNFEFFFYIQEYLQTYMHKLHKCEIPTVPSCYLAKPQPRERAWQNQQGKKTLLNLTLQPIGYR